MNSVPFPSSVETSIVPPMSVTIPFVMGMPSPVPSMPFRTDVLSRSNGSNTRFTKSSLIPTPVSFTRSSYTTPSSSLSVTVMRPPAGVNFHALPTMFRRMRFRRLRSHITNGCKTPDRSMLNSMLFSVICAAKTSAASSRTALMSIGTGSSSTRPDSMRLISRTSLMSARRWWLDASSLPTYSRTFPMSLPARRASSMYPMIAFIGVLMSWLIEERNELLARSRASASACDISSSSWRRRWVR